MFMSTGLAEILSFIARLDNLKNGDVCMNGIFQRNKVVLLFLLLMLMVAAITLGLLSLRENVEKTPSRGVYIYLFMPRVR
ncbi:MAG: hypothetical protein Q8942_00800 [Bacillota bacterium]|nr:hypothetical protein [Bacillota bacterium]